MNIILCCGNGFSTSIVVSKMQQEAKKQGKDHKIWAIPADMLKKDITKADVVLIGPHMVYRKAEIEKITIPANIPMGVIAALDYGQGNGGNVLKQAEDLINQKGKE